MDPEPTRPARRTRPSRRVMRDLLKPVGLEPPDRIRLPATLAAREAGALREQLLAVRGRVVELDGSDVERIGALGLQVLLSAKITWERDNQRLHLINVSEGLSNGLLTLGAASLIQANART